MELVKRLQYCTFTFTFSLFNIDVFFSFFYGTLPNCRTTDCHKMSLKFKVTQHHSRFGSSKAHLTQHYFLLSV